MEILRLRFVGDDRPELPLEIGMYGLGRRPQGGIGLVEDANDARAVARLCVDRRGVWLTVAEGRDGVHVNGRAVRRLAMLRRGDTLHVEGAELRLLGGAPVVVPAPRSAGGGDPGCGLQTVVRGIGGRHHGRSFTLERPRLVGSVAEADIRIDDPAFAERHASFELRDDGVLLRDLGSVDGSVVNGEPVRDAVLQPGDQVVFDAHHRFVIEAPMPRGAGDRDAGEAEAAPVVAAAVPPSRRPWRLPWLLLAALAIAGLLSLLLLYGAA